MATPDPLEEAEYGSLLLKSSLAHLYQPHLDALMAKLSFPHPIY